MSIPLGNSTDPSLTVGLQWRSYSFKVFNIGRLTRALEAEQEKEAIVQAEIEFRDKAEDFARRMADLDWQYGIMLQETELFRINMEEQQTWFNRGIIRELDYLDARTQYLLALNSLLSAKIDRRLYNIEAALLFVPAGY
jgi:outer membrane protein TolC